MLNNTTNNTLLEFKYINIKFMNLTYLQGFLHFSFSLSFITCTCVTCSKMDHPVYNIKMRTY